jgi:hypothetical protein
MPRFFPRERLSTTQRGALHAEVLARQQQLGIALLFPRCNCCGLEITQGQRWHASHEPAPHAITGAPADGIAHDRCNMERAWKVDAKLIAKTQAQKMAAIGAKTPRGTLPFGKNDPRKRRFDGLIVERATGLPYYRRGARGI